MKILGLLTVSTALLAGCATQQQPQYQQHQLPAPGAQPPGRFVQMRMPLNGALVMEVDTVVAGTCPKVIDALTRIPGNAGMAYSCTPQPVGANLPIFTVLQSPDLPTITEARFAAMPSCQRYVTSQRPDVRLVIPCRVQ